MKRDIGEIKDLNIFAKWAKFFIDKYKITIVLLIALVGLGIYGTVMNQRQDFPAVTVNYVFISAVYPGASPEVIALDVLRPIENELKSHEETKKIRSTASPNFGVAVVEVKSFDQDKIKETVSDFGNLVNSAGLPDDVETNISTEDAGGPSLAYVLSSKDLPFEKVIEALPKVAEYFEKESDEIKNVAIEPEAGFEVRVEIDTEKLNESGLNIDAVKQAIEGNLTVLPGGSIKEKETGNEKQISIENPSNSAEDIKNIALPGGRKLSYVADIVREPVSKDSLLMAGYLRDGEPAYSDQVVYLMVSKEDKGDVIRMKKHLDEAVDKIYEKGILDENIEINLTYDSSVYVSTQINSLLYNGCIGLIIILVVFMFFIDIRTGIVIGLIIPFAFLITLFLLDWFGFSINILTTFAMILTLGILVDNAIVIAEGIQHRIRRYGESGYKAAIYAVRDLGPAVTAATLTTIVVFIPFARMGGMMGEIMKYIPYTIIIMLTVSYFLAISITPLLGKWILKKETEADFKKKKLKKWQKYLVIPTVIFYGQRLIDKLVEFYGRVVNKIYKKFILKILALALVLIGLIASFFVLGSGKVEISQFPVTDTSQFAINVDFPTGTSTKIKREVVGDLMKEAIDVPYFQGSFLMEGSIYILITDPSERADDKDTTVYTIVDGLNREVDYVREKAPEGTYINISAAGYGPPSTGSDVILEVKSEDEEAIKKAIGDIDNYVNEKSESGDYKIKRVRNDLADKLIPSVEIKFNKDKLKEYGVTPLTTSLIINSVFSQSETGKITVREDGIQDNVILAFGEDSKKSVEDLNNLLIPNAQGLPVKLEDIAEIKSVDKAESIDYIDGSRAVSYELSLDVEDQEKARIATEIEADLRNYLTNNKLEELGLEEESIAYGGFAADVQADFQNLIVIFFIAIIAVYLILVFQFNSYIQPLLILMAVPIALIGVFPGLWLVGSSLDMISGLGIIALVGIVVNDAIVFIDYFNRQKKKNPNKSLIDTLVYTGKVRFKPIFSTSITTIAAILPLTIMDPFWRGLGTAIIAGLIFATVGNLVVMPIFIYFMEKVFKFFREKRKMKKA